MAKPAFVERYVALIHRLRYFVLVFWTAALIVSAVFGPRLISSTTNSFSPPDHSPAARANSAMTVFFPDLNPMNTVFVTYIEMADGSSVLNDEVASFERSVAVKLAAYSSRECPSPCVIGFASYYTMMDAGLPDTVAGKLVAPGNVSTIIEFSVNLPFIDASAVAFASWAKGAVFVSPSAAVHVTMTGIPAFLPVLQSSIERDMGIMDAVVMPIAMLVLACILRSARLMVIPLAAIAAAALLSFAIVYCVSLSVDIISFVPSLMMSILIAMSVDYSLFLLTRYREALLAGHPSYAAVELMLSSAGHTILISGVCLSICFLGLILFPLNMMQSTGIGCGVAISVTLLVNLTLTPAMLLAFSPFFRRCINPISLNSVRRFWCGRCMEPEAPTQQARLVFAVDRVLNADDEEAAALLPPAARVSKAELQADEHRKFLADAAAKPSVWLRLGLLTQRFPYNILILLVVGAAVTPFALHAFNYTISDTIALDLPRGNALTNAYLRMCAQFGYGTVYPYLIVAVPPNGTSAYSDSFFTMVQMFATELATLPQTSLDDFTSVAVAGGVGVLRFFVEECLTPSYSGYNSSDCVALRYAYATSLNPGATAMLIEFAPAFDPVKASGFTWYKRALSLATAATAAGGYAAGAQFHFAGMPADAWSTIVVTYAYFPWMIGITLAVVLVFVGVATRSVAQPLRSVLSIGLTLMFVFGLATLTYQYSALAWTHIAGLQSTGCIVWLPPVVSVSICIGIALDYDVFLMITIQECRQAGCSSSDATVKGLAKTGSIITTAGIVMAIAFSGLLFSNVTVINQLAFYLVFAVLFDTFVVRSFVVPCILSLLGDLAWWPARLAPVIPSNGLSEYLTIK